EDGIRDWSVTGVQTCALPIYRAHRIHELLKFGRFIVGDLHGVAELDAAMHRDFEIEAGAACPGAPVVDVTGEALLPAIEIDGGDALTGFHQGNGDMQGGGGLARTALLIAQHNDMSRARLPLTSLHQHSSTPVGIFKLPATAVKRNVR